MKKTLRFSPGALIVGVLGFVALAPFVCAESPNAEVKGVFVMYCANCHAGGTAEGGFSLDGLTALESNEKGTLSAAEYSKWFAVLKKIQSGSMPPRGEEQPSPEQHGKLVAWIKYSAFGINPDNPDPGHMTIRRLNQVEYRNSVRDLIGVSYDTTANFPSDDTGHGFDNIGEVLSISPLLLEKYVNAAEEIVSSVVPTVSTVVRQQSLPGDEFRLVGQAVAAPGSGGRTGTRGLELSYYQSASAKAVLKVEFAGDYTVRLNFSANETYVDNQFDENKCELSFSFDGLPHLTETMVRQGGKDYSFDFPMPLTPGDHELCVAVKPLTSSPQIRQLRIQIRSVDLIGPRDTSYYVKPEKYGQFFPRDVPTNATEKREYAKTLLDSFASRAFRRPVDDDSLNRLVDLAESVYSQGATFETGVAKSMTAILASPRFLFREESITDTSSEEFPLIDEYSLASRLSYFLWSTMPDSELIDLARAGQLRKNLDQQVARMLANERSKSFSENFVGQWLRARAVEHIQINSTAVLNREPSRIDPESDARRKRFFELFRLGQRRTEQENREYELEKEKFVKSFVNASLAELTPELRTAMRLESEMLFEHIVKKNRSLLELIDSDYTFLNEALAGHYQIQGLEPIDGNEMRMVKLPEGSHRGGVLTLGSTLVITSNPDRTSPVKRGLFILENLLGTPPAAPPPNIPALEDVASDKNRPLSLRETLAIHRSNSLCSSCHNQMDPLGLALENFNALGKYRTRELDQPIDSAGELTSGEKFSSIDELKKVLVGHHQSEIFRCISEKLMTYALGRAVAYGDSHTLDYLVDELESSDGAAQTLIYGIIRSNAFQRVRKAPSLATKTR
jgi:Protein of unknown function (DUF1592)/Protein of unknown function (DUF1588)/Protein of unknown function (DUF1587)/Protein of unknown function (DUF1595)/Protein of unknown function (DUF1585)/Cytochrome C oxidase, cbb3-type, subunit III